jgi:dCTP deaminase
MNCQHGLLSKNAILRHIKEGNIFISPFDIDNLNTTSYDVRLGENYFLEQPYRESRKILNPFDVEDIKRYWGEPKTAITAEEWSKDNGPLKKIRPKDQIIVLGPGETILAHTMEFIGGKFCVNPHMRARSSIGRIGITVCKCAGWGDVGYCNRWTMEISNHLKDLCVVLVVGMRVAQLAFCQVEPLEETYTSSGGAYQHTDDTKKMMDSWTPYQMLPKFNRENY